MASNPPSQCCVTGFQHDGIPQGELRDINNIRTYYAQPKSESVNTKRFLETAIVFITDVLGMDFINAQLQADRFAQSLGTLVVVPDILGGDSFKFSGQQKDTTDLNKWLERHGTETVDPVIEKTVRYLREDQGFRRIGAVGYCFGAKYVVRFLKPKNGQSFDVGYVAHPSFVAHDELSAIQKPLSISAAEIDSIFTRELRYESEEILVKTGLPWQVTVFSGVPHGFAIRVKLENRQQYWAKEQAFAQAKAWFLEYL